MLMRNPKEFERVAQEWAVKHAGAPKRERGEGSGGTTSETLKQRQQKSKEEEEADRVARCECSEIFSGPRLMIGNSYGGYNEAMINRFVMMGFDLDRVVAAFDFVGIDPNDGEDYPLEEAYIGDITARLLGEP